MTDLIIKELKEKYGESTANKLLSYLDMVLERNEHINLTAVRDRDDEISEKDDLLNSRLDRINFMEKKNIH